METFEQSLLAAALGPFANSLQKNPQAWSRATCPTAMGGFGILAIAIECGVSHAFDNLILDALVDGDRSRADQLREQRRQVRNNRYGTLAKGVRDSLSPQLLTVFNDTSSPYAASWTSIIPNTRDGTLFTPAEGNVLLAFYLGLPVFPDRRRPCNCCPAGMQADPYGLHPPACRRVMPARHNNVLNYLAALLRRHLPPTHVVTEQRIDADGLPAPPQGGPRPVDFGYYDPLTDKWHLLDIIIKASPGSGASPSLAVAARANKEASLSLSGAAVVQALAFGAYGSTDGASRTALRNILRTLRPFGCHLPLHTLLGHLQLIMWKALVRYIVRRRSEPFDPGGRAQPRRIRRGENPQGGLGVSHSSAHNNSLVDDSSDSSSHDHSAAQVPANSRKRDPPQHSLVSHVCAAATVWAESLRHFPQQLAGAPAAAFPPPPGRPGPSEAVRAFVNLLAPAAATRCGLTWTDLCHEVKARTEITHTDWETIGPPQPGGKAVKWGKLRTALGLGRMDALEETALFLSFVRACTSRLTTCQHTRFFIEAGAKLLNRSDCLDGSGSLIPPGMPRIRGSAAPQPEPYDFYSFGTLLPPSALVGTQAQAHPPRPPPQPPDADPLVGEGLADLCAPHPIRHPVAGGRGGVPMIFSSHLSHLSHSSEGT